MPEIAYLTILILLIRGSGCVNIQGVISRENFTLDGIAEVLPGGLCKLTDTSQFKFGHAIYSAPFPFKNTSNGNASSFSTVFVFAVVPDPDSSLYADGMAFFISPYRKMEGVEGKKYLGLFNRSNNGKPSNHIVAVELDTYQNEEFNDIDNNHVGIDINNLTSVAASTAGYYVNGEFKNLSLASGVPIQAWVDYDGVSKQFNVTLAPLDHPQKPNQPLLSAEIDISPYILDDMYVGFSGSTGTLVHSTYVLAWSFAMNGRAQQLDLSKLPALPVPKKSNRKKKLLAILVPVLGSVTILAAILIRYFIKRRQKLKFAEVLEDWEVQYGPHRFTYKDLYEATKGFSEKELLGRGGFGQVYRGVLPVSRNQIAVKRVTHNSTQGMKGFVAEIATIGRIRHPNLVRLLGYCRREGELFLVYDYMPNNSLDKFIFDNPKTCLDWDQRFSIIKDVATGLTYLHEEWVEVVIHRDIKASNVLLDGELNGKLGDFGLARSSDPGNDDVHTTQLAGTLGYMPPEVAINGKSTTRSDVFAFGVFCLEVACGRRPVDPRAPPEEVILLEWVAECWKKGEILRTADPKLENEFESEQMETVLKLGLLCTHFVPRVRPAMSQVKRYLYGENSALQNLDSMLTGENWKDIKDFLTTYASTSGTQEASVSGTNESVATLTISDMFISMGR